MVKWANRDFDENDSFTRPFPRGLPGIIAHSKTPSSEILDPLSISPLPPPLWSTGNHGLVIRFNWPAPSFVAFFQQQTFHYGSEFDVAAHLQDISAVTQRLRSELQQVLRQADYFLGPVGPAQHINQYLLVNDATLFQLVEKAQVDVQVVDDCADGVVYHRSVIRLRFSHGLRRRSGFRFAYRCYFSRCIASTSNYRLDKMLSYRRETALQGAL